MENNEASQVAIYFECLEDLICRPLFRPPLVNRRLRPPQARSGPKTLVCRDERGGYLPEDLYGPFVIGDNEQPPYVHLFFWYTDIFVYFSHKFLTVPTVRWINSCHEHDVLCLGTLITEGATGQAICSKILSNEQLMEQLIDDMVGLCDEWHFDGWLINIENQIEPPLVSALLVFLQRLRTALKTRIGTYAQLVWYDSVTHEGKLQWQNCLNDRNLVFADVVDAFYTNYNWTLDHLKRTRRLLETEECRLKATDIYFGVDVFGRGSYGGGQFNTHVAVQAARNYGFSSAIFAPGWTTEAFEANGLALHDQLFRSMTQTLYPHRLRRSFKAHFDRGLTDNNFDPLLTTVLPHLLESSDLRMTAKGLEIGGKKGVEHTLYLTDFRAVSSYEIEHNSKENIIVGAHLQACHKRYLKICSSPRYNIFEIFCVKLVDQPVVLTYVSFTFC